MPKSKKVYATEAPVTLARPPWWESTALAHASRDKANGKPPGRCPCMVCLQAKREGFRPNA